MLMTGNTWTCLVPYRIETLMKHTVLDIFGSIYSFDNLQVETYIKMYTKLITHEFITYKLRVNFHLFFT